MNKGTLCKKSRKKSIRKRLIKKFLFLFFFCTLPLTFINYSIAQKTTATVIKITTNNKNSNANSNIVVCIDPGHGGYDNGAKSSSNILEKNITLNVALEVGKKLNKEGIKVIYTRNSDNVTWPSNEKLDVRERVKISNDAKADIFVSIHCNANKDTSYKGIETWCRFPDTEGESLAKNIQKELANLNYSEDRGLKYESTSPLAVLKLNNSVSSLVELGFLTNSSDAKFITSKNGQVQCAEAIAKAIINYLSTRKM